MILTILPRYLSSAAVDWLVRNSSRAISMKAACLFRAYRQTFSFQSENEYENEIPNTKLCARLNHRHSIFSLSENVAVAEICYQRWDVLSFCDRPGEGLASFSIKITMQTLLVKKTKTKTKESKMKLFSGVYIFWEYAKEIDRSLISSSRSSHSNLKIPSNCLMINVFCLYLSTFKSYIHS